MSRSGYSALICCLAAVLLGGGMCPAVEAFWIVKANPIHQEITRNGLNPIGPIPLAQLDGPKFEFLLSNGASLTFSLAVIEEINDHNIEVDEFQGFAFSERHFDSDDMAGGSKRLVQLRQEVVNTLVNASFFDLESNAAAVERAKRAEKARLLLGEALHTLQDFYAHTNWVEMHYANGTEIQADLGNKSIKSPAFQDACNESTPASGGKLSSGWFDEDDLPLFCQKPANKCAHGFSGSCGLNKDFAGRGPRYFQARQLAIRATHVYTRETLQAVISGRTQLQPALSAAAAQQAVNLAVCEFMGVPDPVSTCLTSHTLTVQKINQAGGGATLSGLVQSSSGNLTPAIDCGQLCQGTAVAGTEVQLTASDTPPWVFVRWDQGGACAGSTSRSCAVAMNSNQTARAVFAEALPIPMSVSGSSHFCYLEIYARQYICDGPGETDSGFLTFQGELGADYGGTPQSGGGIANIKAQGQVNAQPGQASIKAVLDGAATGQWFARGQQSVTGSYGVSANVTSNTLPIGTPVSVRVTFHLSSQRSVSVEFSEPVQWFATPFQLRASLGANGDQRIVSLDGADSDSESVDFIVQTTVGSGISIYASLQLLFQYIDVTRVSVKEEISANVNGPYLSEVSGLNVQFIQN